MMRNMFPLHLRRHGNSRLAFQRLGSAGIGPGGQATASNAARNMKGSVRCRSKVNAILGFISNSSKRGGAERKTVQMVLALQPISSFFVW